MKDEGAVTLIEEYHDEYKLTGSKCKFTKRRANLRWFNIVGIISDPASR